MTSHFPAASQVLEAALGSLPIPAYTNGLDGRITWQNEASRAAAGDLRGLHFSEAVPPDELQRARETFAAVTLSGQTRRRTGSYRMKDGQLARMDVIVAPIRLEGKVVGIFGIAIPSGAGDRPAALEQLSPRQLDVLRLLVQGKSTVQIADELHVAPETVRNHIRRLLTALGARTRLEAALIALRHGLVSLDQDED